VQMKPRVAEQPAMHFWCFVRPLVVEDQMHVEKILLELLDN
jgi:hypothetical protein